MTTTAPTAAHHAQTQAPTTRQYIRYLFYKVRPSWHHEVRADQHERMRAELVQVLAGFKEKMAVLRAYSTLGTRGDADFMLWMVSERLEDFQELQSALLGTTMGIHFDTPYSYLAMTRRSQYVDKHIHEDGEGEGRRTRVRPLDRKYLFVYPMVKKRPCTGCRWTIVKRQWTSTSASA